MSFLSENCSKVNPTTNDLCIAVYSLLRSLIGIELMCSHWCAYINHVAHSITVLCFITGLLLLILRPKWSQICDRQQTGSECAVNSSQSCRSLNPLQTVRCFLFSLRPQTRDESLIQNTHYTTVTHTPDTLLVEKWLLRDKNRGQVINQSKWSTHTHTVDPNQTNY